MRPARAMLRFKSSQSVKSGHECSLDYAELTFAPTPARANQQTDNLSANLSYSTDASSRDLRRLSTSGFLTEFGNSEGINNSGENTMISEPWPRSAAL